MMGRLGPLVSGAVYEAKLGSKLISFLWSSAVRGKWWREMKGREEERQRREKGSKIDDSKEEGREREKQSENRLSRELEEGNKGGGAIPLYYLSLTHVP